MSWVLDVEQRHCIYRVPACIKDANPKAYRPQVVSLGPFHHGDAKLLSMEGHKRRALGYLLRRSGRTLEEFRVAMQDVAEQLESVYLDLGDEWRGGEGGGGERFLEMLIVDGCFLLELLRAAGVDGSNGAGDYAPNDPVFSSHGVLYMAPFIRRDMLMLENQLPLLLLQRLVAVMTATPPSNEAINGMVLRFLSPSSRVPPASDELGFHPLAVYHGSLVHGPYRVSRDVPDTGGTEIIRPAVELHGAGVRFKKSWTNSLRDIRFRRGVLSVPALSVDDSTEYALLNMMAFERLHAGAGNDVAAYVFLMNKVLDSARDVALLGSMGIIQNAAGSDKAVAKLFERMSRDMVLDPSGTALDAVHRQVNAYCRRPWSVCGGGARHSRSDSYFRIPWALLAAVLLIMVFVQTIYTVLQFYMLRQR
ncbi:hypothetical protein BAE44_0016101 [Dichanthelium oligosanthes]|uniref:Uncharacterized protein n=1 Tax=Dichanthelium oligosanthes TaxID=888268 RepID=A0A1E5VCP1_9POAL|nr:hypothetical protein BAE44_0016101 [Dichanthelium oligosanthes]